MNNLYNKIYEAINEGIQKALILNSDNDVSVKFQHKEISTEFIPYEYRTVDMGNAGIWCKYNLGSFPGNKASDWYGDYYAWGEIETKDNYSWETYKHCKGTKNTITKYNKTDWLIRLEPIDDIVTQTLGNKFRMPTKEEYEKLINNTTNEWVKNYKNINGLNGRLFTAENGNTLFFPAAGYYLGSQPYFAGEYGIVWSASFSSNKPYSAFRLYFYSSGVGVRLNDRYYGFPVHGVQNSFSN